MLQKPLSGQHFQTGHVIDYDQLLVISWLNAESIFLLALIGNIYLRLWQELVIFWIVVRKFMVDRYSAVGNVRNFFDIDEQYWIFEEDTDIFSIKYGEWWDQ